MDRPVGTAAAPAHPLLLSPPQQVVERRTTVNWQISPATPVSHGHGPAQRPPRSIHLLETLSPSSSSSASVVPVRCLCVSIATFQTEGGGSLFLLPQGRETHARFPCQCKLPSKYLRLRLTQIHRLKEFTACQCLLTVSNVGVMMTPSSDRGAPLQSNAFLLNVCRTFGVVSICLRSAESACRLTG